MKVKVRQHSTTTDLHPKTWLLDDGVEEQECHSCDDVEGTLEEVKREI